MATKQDKRPIVTTGTRGGLGRTLLTAFLLLAIVPLSIISFLAVSKARQNIRQEVTAKLAAVATLKEAQIQQWMDERSYSLAMLSARPDVRQAATALLTQHPSSDVYRTAYANLGDDLRAELARDASFAGFSLLRGASGDEPLLEVVAPHEQSNPETTPPDNPHAAPSSMLPTLNVAVPITDPEGETLGRLVGWPDLTALNRIMIQATGLGDTGETYLVTLAGQFIPALSTDDSASPPHSLGIDAALAGRSGGGLYDNYVGQPVVGAYRWLPEWQIALLAEQAQTEAFASNDDLVTMLIGATLAVALLTTALAAVVTRQLTRPIVQLTVSAVRIAGGNLEQTVPVDRRDEIGILAQAFNVMTAELKTLYQGLEQKVAERTQQLREANRRLRYRAMQLAVGAEVGRVVTSILDLDALLNRVVKLIQSCYNLSSVAVFLLDDSGQWAELREGIGEANAPSQIERERVNISEPSLIGRVAREGQPQMLPGVASPGEPDSPSLPRHSQAVFPLKIGDRVIGVLDVHSARPAAFDENDLHALGSLADQIAVAIENARAYELEREAAKQLREAEEMRRRFLAHMSHELREPLTNIIGFSQLILKGIDGPISEQQRNDLEIVQANSQHLLGLINDLLDVAQIEAGLMELEFKEVDLTELIRSVMATTSALTRDRDIQLRQEIYPDLPRIEADGTRVRQVLLKLLSNAAKFTERGSITVRAWLDGNSIQVAVADTGSGMSPEDRERVFEQFEQGDVGVKYHRPGIGLGLALCKEFVEMHGGRIWVESQEGVGSTFTFTLPIQREGTLGQGRDYP